MCTRCWLLDGSTYVVHPGATKMSRFEASLLVGWDKVRCGKLCGALFDLSTSKGQALEVGQVVAMVRNPLVKMGKGDHGFCCWSTSITKGI